MTVTERPTRPIDPRAAELLDMGLEVAMTEKVAEWRTRLRKGEVTEEMAAVFIALGWLIDRDRTPA